MASRLKSFARLGAAGAAVALAMLTFAPIAAAHTELRASNPEQGATVENLTEVRLEFTSDLLELGTDLVLVDATGVEHELTSEFPSANAVTAKVEFEFAAGDAQVQWRVVAQDGHPIEGVLDFTYAPADAPEPTEPAQPSVTAEPTDAATTAPEPTASAPVPEESAVATPISAPVPEDQASGTPGWVWPALALAALGGAGVALAVAKLRGKP